MSKLNFNMNKGKEKFKYVTQEDLNNIAREQYIYMLEKYVLR
ncbi:MAG: hypothetical protein ACK5HL_04645 [Bacilli bacterium]